MRDWNKDWEMCQRATPGGWKWHDIKITKQGVRYIYKFSLDDEKQETVMQASAVFDNKTGEFVPYIDISYEDAEFIAEAREALPYWMKRVAELEREKRQ